MGKSASLAGYFHFLWAGVVKHHQTGAFFPSQKALAKAMIAPIPSAYDGLILELGSGTGVVTLALADRCPRARILACELNPVLAQDTRHSLDRAGINGQVQVRARPAQEVLLDLQNSGAELPGYVISALPLGNLRKDVVADLLQSISRLLPKEGVFVQVQHFLVDLNKVRRAFKHVRTVAVLRNIPPLFVYYAAN
jgi:phosphatidylethanolamine/phosphatidyl-N-methylethanolamine N-methyltransferase